MLAGIALYLGPHAKRDGVPATASKPEADVATFAAGPPNPPALYDTRIAAGSTPSPHETPISERDSIHGHTIVLVDADGQEVTGEVWIVDAQGGTQSLAIEPHRPAWIAAHRLSPPTRLLGWSMNHGSGERLLVAEPLPERIEVSVLASGAIEGFVADASGNGLASGISVVASWPGVPSPTATRSPFLFEASTDRNGRFRIQGPHSGRRYVLSAAGAGFASQFRQATYAVGGQSGVELRLAPLYGAILDCRAAFAELQSESSPCQDAPIQRSQTAQKLGAEMVVGNAALVFAGLVDPEPPGARSDTVRVLWTAASWEEPDLPVTVAFDFQDGNSAKASFRAPRVWDRVPTLQSDFQLKRKPPSERALLHTQLTLPRHLPKAGETAALGTLTLLGERGDSVLKPIRADEPYGVVCVQEGAYRLHFRSLSGAVDIPTQGEPLPLVVLLGESSRFTLDMSQFGGLQLEFVDADGGPLLGTVQVRIARLSASEDVPLDGGIRPQGVRGPAYFEPLLPPGIYQIHASAKGANGTRAQGRAAIRAGETSRLRLELQPFP